MAKLTDSINTFQTGDLVFTRYPPKGPQPIHVTVFLEPRTGLGRSYVHAGATHLEIADVSTYKDDKDSGGYLHAQPSDTTRRERAAEVATAFGTIVKRTPYGSYPASKDFTRLNITAAGPHASRFTGMIRTTSFDQIPFEFPSLSRLLKWTLRYLAGEPLSENRGITCAAFVAICHQVAGMSLFFEEVGLAYNPEKLKKCKHKLDSLVETKESLRNSLEKLGEDPDRDGKPIYRDQAYRENSNRKLTPEGKLELESLKKDVNYRNLPPETQSPRRRKRLSEVELYWLAIQTQWLEIHEASTKLIEEIVTRPFLFDAKYVSSPVLAQRVQGIGWKTTVFEAY